MSPYLFSLNPLANVAFLLWRADRRYDAAQRLLTATLDEWSEDRKALLQQLGETRAELLTANAEEREAWIKERRELNNRVQAPDVAVVEGFQPTIQPSVGFDDDESFWEAKEEALSNGDQ
jgi:hypothetical protein